MYRYIQRQEHSVLSQPPVSNLDRPYPTHDFELHPKPKILNTPGNSLLACPNWNIYHMDYRTNTTFEPKLALTAEHMRERPEVRLPTAPKQIPEPEENLVKQQEKLRRRVSFAANTKTNYVKKSLYAHTNEGRLQHFPTAPAGYYSSQRLKRRCTKVDDHHYDLGVPVNHYAKLKRFMSFFISGSHHASTQRQEKKYFHQRRSHKHAN